MRTPVGANSKPYARCSSSRQASQVTSSWPSIIRQTRTAKTYPGVPRSGVPQQGDEIVAGQLLPAPEELEFDETGDAGDGAAEALDEVGRRGGGPTGCEHVV